MRRVVVHGGFAALAGALAVVLGAQLVGLERAGKSERALAAVPAVPLPDTPPPEPPRARLAFASALAGNGDVDAAEALLAELVRRHDDDPIGRAARFALANRYLREGAHEDLDPRLARPLLELAKQRYRDILRATPDDWDARYNLERALRLAPERSVGGEEDKDVVKRVDVVVPDFEPKDLP